MNGKLTLALVAALAATGCAAFPHLAHSQSPQAQKVAFDCNVTQTEAFKKALGYTEPYCIAAVDLDNDPKTSELLAINPGAGGSGGDPLAVFQKAGSSWNRIDNQDQFAFFDGVAIRPAGKGWNGIVTNYGNGNPENLVSYTGGKYRSNPVAPK